MKKWKLPAVICLLLICPAVTGQPEMDGKILDYADALLNETDNEDLVIEEIEELSEILQRRENINSISPEILGRLPFITDFQAYSFLEYRKKYGRIYSKNELRLIPGFHEDLIEKFSVLFDYGSYREPSKAEKMYKPAFRHKLLLRFKTENPSREGFVQQTDPSSAFRGGNLYRLIKYETERKGKLRIGFTMENDAGEGFSFDSVNRGFDFNSAFIEYTGKNKVDRIIFGDFRISSAEGLIYSYGRKGKTPDVSFRRSMPELKKYSSTAEYGFCRGISARFNHNNFRVIAFYSRKKEGAKIYDKDSGSAYFLSVNTTGNNRNTDERNKKNTIVDESAGTILSFTNDHFQAGYNIKYRNYKPGLAYYKRGDPYSEFIIREQFFWQSGFYNLQFRNIFLSGELASLNQGGISLQQKISLQMHPLLTINFGYRNFSPEYFCPGAGSLSESSDPGNEIGFFTGILAYPFSFLKLRLYIDQYSFPWIDRRSSFPSSGLDFLADSEWYILKDLDLRVYYKTEKKGSNESGSVEGIKKMTQSRINRFYIQFSYLISGNLSSRFRLEIKTQKKYPDEHNSGILFYKELTKSLIPNSLKINLRYTIFDIPHWDVRIYSWEHDLLYSFSSPSYYKSGYNVFLNLRWKITSKYSTGLKISSTVYSSVRESGSGPDFRKSDKFHSLKLQFLMKF